jgi:hypothetical protein
MDAQMQEGKVVTVMSYGGKKLERTVVRDLGSVILICKPEEFAQALVEKREPIAVGFKKEFVVYQSK